MQATRSDAFALKKSGLDAFLYADVLAPDCQNDRVTLGSFRLCLP
jgi:hypothetical protein